MVISVYTRSYFVYMPMHDVTPKVVAMAVSTVIITCNTLLQICLFSLLIVFVVLSLCFQFLGTDYTDCTEPVLC